MLVRPVIRSRVGELHSVVATILSLTTGAHSGKILFLGKVKFDILEMISG